MNGDTGFAVPKEKQRVTVRLETGAALEGTIFLEYSPGALSVFQKISAFLEDGSVFFPLLLSATGRTEFINKKNVEIVEADYPEETGTGAVSLSLMRIENITALFKDGSAMSGALMAEVPGEKSRLSDCLNLPNKFLSVRVGGKIHFINKDMIHKVVYAEKRGGG